jgi:hypothetical protein
MERRNETLTYFKEIKTAMAMTKAAKTELIQIISFLFTVSRGLRCCK